MLLFLTCFLLADALSNDLRLPPDELSPHPNELRRSLMSCAGHD
jgi:hypothetical protein